MFISNSDISSVPDKYSRTLDIVKIHRIISTTKQR